MAFQKTGSQEELRATMSPERIAAQETVYAASRGGWFPQTEKPVPGTPKDPK